MIANQTQIDPLTDKTLNRVLADIAAAPEPSLAELLDAAYRRLDALPGACFRAICLNTSKYGPDGPMRAEWRASVSEKGNDKPICQGYGKTIPAAADEACAKWAASVREARIRERVEREFAALEAADSATKHETGKGAASTPSESSASRENGVAAPKPTTTNTRDDGEAVSGTLPRGPVTHTGMPKGDFDGISNPDRRGA